MTWAQTIELVSLVAGGIVTVLGGREAIARGLRWWAAKKVERDAALLGAQKEIAIAQIHAQQNERDREERTEARLWDRVERVERRLDECEEKHRDAEQRSEECERRSSQQGMKIVELEEHVKALQEVALRNDDTGRFLLETRSSPPSPLDLPPPRRGDDS